MPSTITSHNLLTAAERDAWIDELSRSPNPAQADQMTVVLAAICVEMRRIGDILDDVHDDSNGRIKTRHFVDISL